MNTKGSNIIGTLLNTKGSNTNGTILNTYGSNTNGSNTNGPPPLQALRYQIQIRVYFYIMTNRSASYRLCILKAFSFTFTLSHTFINSIQIIWAIIGNVWVHDDSRWTQKCYVDSVL